MPEKLRAGIIGTGGIAGWHVTAFRAQENVDLVAASDIDAGRAAAFGERHGILHTYGDNGAMLREQGLDIVAICTWPKAHLENVLQSADTGVRAILCEKPVALSLGQIDAMSARCQEKGILFAVGHRHRFSPNFGLAKQLIQEGAIGRPQKVLGVLSLTLLDNGPHLVDQMRNQIGDLEAEWVMGQIDRQGDASYQGTPVESSSVGLVGFAGGVHGFIQMGERMEKDYRLRILGEEGIVDATSGSVRLLNGHAAGWQVLDREPSKGFVEQTAEMLRWLAGGPEHRCSLRRVRPTMEILMAILESARLRRAIDLPLKQMDYPIFRLLAEEKGPR